MLWVRIWTKILADRRIWRKKKARIGGFAYPYSPPSLLITFLLRDSSRMLATSQRQASNLAQQHSGVLVPLLKWLNIMKNLELHWIETLPKCCLTIDERNGKILCILCGLAFTVLWMLLLLLLFFSSSPLFIHWCPLFFVFLISSWGIFKNTFLTVSQLKSYTYFARW